MLSGIKMTKRQYQVYSWLLSKTDSKREIAISYLNLSLEFNFTEGMARKILKILEDKEIIELLAKGIGRKPSKYRLARINLKTVIITNKPKITEISEESAKSPQRDFPAVHILEETKEKQKSSQQNKPPFRGGLVYEKENTHARIAIAYAREDRDKRNPARDSIKSLFSVSPKIATKKPSIGPFKRFEDKKYKPQLWNAQDIVCYYAYLYKSFVGSMPVIDWKKDVGAARNLLKTFEGGPIYVKRFLQLSFALTGSHVVPTSLNWFTQSWLINKVLPKWDNDDLAEDFEDRFVLV